jgi:hypothetical protein
VEDKKFKVNQNHFFEFLNLEKQHDVTDRTSTYRDTPGDGIITNPARHSPCVNGGGVSRARSI